MKYLVPLLLTSVLMAVVIGLVLHQARLDAAVVARDHDRPRVRPDLPMPTEEVPG